MPETHGGSGVDAGSPTAQTEEVIATAVADTTSDAGESTGTPADPGAAAADATEADEPRIPKSRFDQVNGKLKDAETANQSLQARVAELESIEQKLITETGKLADLEPWAPVVKEMSQYARDPEQAAWVQRVIEEGPDGKGWASEREADLWLEAQQLKVANARQKEANERMSTELTRTKEERTIAAEEARWEAVLTKVSGDYPALTDDLLLSFLERNPKAGEVELRAYCAEQTTRLAEHFGKAGAPATDAPKTLRAGQGVTGGARPSSDEPPGGIDSRAAVQRRHARLRELISASSQPGS